MSTESFMRILEELIEKAKLEKMWGTINVEFKDGEIKFIHKNETKRIN